MNETTAGASGTSGDPTVTVIVPVRDDAERLKACLASVRANGWNGATEIMVADNGSRDDSVSVARAAGATVFVLPGRSVSALRNEAARRARGDILAFIDADHLIDAGWLAAAIDVLGRPGVAAAGAPYMPPPQTTWVQRAYDRLRVREAGVQNVPWLGSGNLVIRRAVFEALGGFDIALQTCEDVEFCTRLRGAGWRLVSDDRLKSVHMGDPASLRAVLLGELWRGRDNLKVTLRGPLAARSYVSLLLSVASLILIGVTALGLVTLPWAGPWPAAIGAMGFMALAVLRAARMTLSSRAWRGRDVVGTLAVAFVYELARGLALVVRTSHRARRELAEQRS